MSESDSVAPTSLVKAPHRNGGASGEERPVKYMIMLYGSQQDYDLMAGKPTDRPAWSAGRGRGDVRVHGVVEQGTRRVWGVRRRPWLGGSCAHQENPGLRDGVPVVTDGPYPETQEVLAGYTIVECESFDRATEIAARITRSPSPRDTSGDYIEVRPIVEGFEELVV